MSILLTVLAVARVTRFITSDVLFEVPRGWILTQLIKRHWDRPVYLIVCDWCASVYVGTAAAGAWYVWGENMAFMATTLALAASYVTGFASTITERGE